MLTVAFDKFGGKLGGFSANEEIMLRQALRDACELSNLAVVSSGSGFGNKRDLLRRWFGSNGPATIRTVQTGLATMNNILNGSGTIRFVDARNRSEKFYTLAEVPAPGAAGRYGAKIVRSSAPDVLPMTADDYAYVKCLKYKSKIEPGHVGSGMRVYIGETGFLPGMALKDRSMTVYHELTHKFLDTVDYNAARQTVYGVRACEQLAIADPAQALKHADCWTYFVAGFKYTL